MLDAAPIYYGRQRPKHNTLYRLVQEHAASLIAHTDQHPVELAAFIVDEFDALRSLE